jgi:hypothetical protein
VAAVMTTKSRVHPHVFVSDPEVPPDHIGRRACAAPGCHLMGEPGDAHHTVPELGPDARSAAAGERSEG